ncbi:hypothetical protein FA048_17820 [Pedobacter polaris]|uniref:F5/8 type C domain-containing protein n=1 Tax=Pedobacter polaris TaxID=2571273 RepID=A0A4U1CHZ5_9SPHI|nr:beta-L-arabinofuranosidase domain-containing protein [Pedobacter polaris]TKC05580.1 hypothetical protein FA048_17820 [Pedobacter polaris]
MYKLLSLNLLLLFNFSIANCLAQSFQLKKSNGSSDLLIPIAFNKVKLTDKFWSERIRIQKEVLVPVAFDRTKNAVEDLQRTANYLSGKEGPLPSNSRFSSSDLFKVIEGAAYLLQIGRDAKLEKEIDDLATIIAAAQQKDGYFYPPHITGSYKSATLWGESGMGDKPYSWEVHSHELYNIGHLYEAAVAYYQATGKRNLLEVAEKSAKHVNKVFFEGDPKYNNGKPVNQAPGHEEIELALVKLYRVTGNKLYLDMSKNFLNIRGVTYMPNGKGPMSPEYAQQHKPVREQDKAVGHAVRAMYLYSAMSDVGAFTDDSSLNPALNKIWKNITDTRMHITGGLGAVQGIEGFGDEFLLPNKEAYNETCAAVGNVFFNHRMFLLNKDGKYMDIAEVALLNNVLAGVNLEGNKFFYVNPLQSEGMVDRSHWFGTACCPTNLARLIPQVSGMMYANTQTDIYCVFYTSSTTVIPLSSGNVYLKQTSNYPFDELIKLEINPTKPNQTFAVKLRIPSWTGFQFVPGGLYKFTDNDAKPWSIWVNGKQIKDDKVNKGFVSINRKWNKGDKVELRLPMPVRYTKADERVEADRNRIAITRGPIVYCAEGVDNNADVTRYYIPAQVENPIVSKGDASELPNIEFVRKIPAKYIDLKGEVHNANLNLLPYYAWNNRGVSTMNIWFPENEPTLREELISLPKEINNIKASYTNTGENVFAIVNGKFPKHSFDNSIARWTSYPQKGKAQSIELSFEKSTAIKSFAVYWYDDKGGVQVPQSWNLEYSIDESTTWKPYPLYSTDTYTILKDQFNLVHSNGDSFSVKKIKLNILPKNDSAAGILQVQVDVKR